MSQNNDLKSHKRGEKVKWAFTLIAFLLVFVLFAGLCLQLFGKGKVKPSEWVKKDVEQDEQTEPADTTPQLIRFEAEDGKLEGGCKVSEGALPNVTDFTSGATVTFEIDASKAAEKSKLCIRITAPKESMRVTDAVKVTMNGKEIVSASIVKGSKTVTDSWQYVLVGEVDFVEGTNTLVFGGTDAACKFDYFKFTVPSDVTLSLHGEAGLSVSEASSNGISLMSATVPRVEYAALGVPSIAEGAQTITATVYPDNDAENTKLEWTAEFVDGTSEWAMGKEVSDYISLSYGDAYDTSKKCTVSCLQPFGEQIKIIVRAVYNSEVTAEVTADYIQRVSVGSLSFGDLDCDWGGHTDVIMETCPTGIAPGGMPEVHLSYSDVYTIPADPQVEYILSVEGRYRLKGLFVESVYDDGEYAYCHSFAFWTEAHVSFEDEEYARPYGTCFDFSSFDVKEKGLYFSTKWLHENMSFSEFYLEYGYYAESTHLPGPSIPSSSIRDYYDNQENKIYPDIFSLEVRCSNYGYTSSKYTTFRVSGMTYNSVISDVGVDDSDLYY